MHARFESRPGGCLVLPWQGYGLWTRFRQISNSKKIKGLAVLARQGYWFIRGKDMV